MPLAVCVVFQIFISVNIFLIHILPVVCGSTLVREHSVPSFLKPAASLWWFINAEG